MIEKAKITFFKINGCGYYTSGPKTKHAFCSVADLLGQLAKWSHGKNLAQTQTFTPSAEDTFLPVFLFDIHQLNGDWLITLWNQTPATDNAVASVMANGGVGNATVYMNGIVPGSIPGFATYFWFFPDKDLIANVRFQHPVSGHTPMRSYLRGFIEKSTDHVVYAPTATTGTVHGAVDIEIAGYRKDANSPIQTNLNPRFSTAIFTKPGDEKLLLQKVNSITKVRRRSTLELQTAENLALWQHLWRNIKGTARAAQTDPVTVEFDIKTVVTRAEVEDIIEQWHSLDEKAAWDDFGFEFRGEQQPLWLSRSYARETFELEVKRQNAEVAEGKSLLKELHARRKNILQLIE